MRALLIMLLMPGCAFAGSVYKCTDSSGAVSFQSRPCADEARAEEVAIRRAPDAPPAPEPAPEPDPPEAAAEPPPVAAPAQAPSPRAAESWRCSMENGEVWYQHTPCPNRLYFREHLVLSNGSLGPLVEVGKRVSEQAVSRSDACREINRPAAATRKGSARDQKADSYAKMQGKDPC